jgi:hypothetical protein
VHETKQKKMTMSVGSLLSSLGAHKQNKTRRQQASAHHRLLCVHRIKTKKMMMSANWS